MRDRTRQGWGRPLLLAAILLLSWLSPTLTNAQETDPRKDMIVRSGLPVPRFVSLRSNEVNVRAGPGRAYPIEWVFVRAGMPVEITAEFDTWRRIRDVDGTQGWVHQSMLSGRRTLVVTKEIRTIRERPNSSAAAVAQAEPGVMGRLVSCKGDWCEVEIQGYNGWMERGDFWGVRPDEKLED
ncbi:MULTISPECIES: SH3 domain-containing protein [unclassified Azospirillum]|uniref:SH3 domain-containing protein n=1 Tax=unclassified Azospirillum TaxID=2630922 RepID=UPI000B75B4DB|nr:MULTISPECIES: SH3 domain-containing protein [unclassified Azospirillum]SNR83708.1 SH3-like domain-containing protein [Azospirillum sp. RU38E]SNR99247.1 SH3-like domain-containing protein [Azospirillum sp. RU37A]